MCIYMAASPVDVTRGVVTCRSNASVPDVHMRLGHYLCANFYELATAGSPPAEGGASRLMMNDDDSLEGAIFGPPDEPEIYSAHQPQTPNPIGNVVCADMED